MMVFIQDVMDDVLKCRCGINVREPPEEFCWERLRSDEYDEPPM